MNRYHRQILLDQIGPAGQQRLGRARILLVGCGALGTVIAEQLVRAGAGELRIADRDIVELTNLQRQTLFDESDARDGIPKAIAAAGRLSEINSEVSITPMVVDVTSENIEPLAAGVDVILDGTDNAETRYLINDLAVKRELPWVYGACVGMEGRVMPILPGSACLRCIFPTPPEIGELPTCDTAGVFGPAAGVVAMLQAAEALKLLATDAQAGMGGSQTRAYAPRNLQMTILDLWSGRVHQLPLRDSRHPDCPCCGRRRFDFLNAPAATIATLCGRDAVQIPAPRSARLDLNALAGRLQRIGQVEQTPYLLRCRLPDGPILTIFPDARALITGATSLAHARSIHARYIG